VFFQEIDSHPNEKRQIQWGFFFPCLSHFRDIPEQANQNSPGPSGAPSAALEVPGSSPASPWQSRGPEAAGARPRSTPGQAARAPSELARNQVGSRSKLC